MTLNRYLLPALLAALCAPSIASAQVVRCEDANGHVTYTNAGCPKSQALTEIVPQLSAEEKAKQQAQYQQALEQKYAQQQRQAALDAAQREAEAARPPAPTVQRPPPPPPEPAPAPVESNPPYYYGSGGYAPEYLPMPQRPPRPRPPAPPKPQPPKPPTPSGPGIRPLSP